MRRDHMKFEVWAPDAWWPAFNTKKLIKSKEGALSYVRYLRDRWGHLAKMAIVFVKYDKEGNERAESVHCALRTAWDTLIGRRPRWMAMGPPPTSWIPQKLA